jgi:hypothetical protein
MTLDRARPESRLSDARVRHAIFTRNLLVNEIRTAPLQNAGAIARMILWAAPAQPARRGRGAVAAMAGPRKSGAASRRRLVFLVASGSDQRAGRLRCAAPV